MGDLIYLEVVFHCFHENGIKGAARKLKRAESTVREKLRKFERISGFPIFQRVPWKPLPIAELIVKTIAAPAMEGMAQYYRGRHTLLNPHIRFAGPHFALHTYILPLVRMLRVAHPELIVSLDTGRRSQLLALLDANELDLALILAEAPPEGYGWQQILALPLMFYVPANSGFTAMEDILQTAPTPNLICPPAGEAVTQRLETFLRERNVYWPVKMNVGAAALVPPSVAAGMGIGPSVGLSAFLDLPGIRVVPIPVEDVYLGVAWKKEPDACTRKFLELLARGAPRVASELLAKSLAAHAVPKTTLPAIASVKPDPRVVVKTGHGQLTGVARVAKAHSAKIEN